MIWFISQLFACVYRPLVRRTAVWFSGRALCPVAPPFHRSNAPHIVHANPPPVWLCTVFVCRLLPFPPRPCLYIYTIRRIRCKCRTSPPRSPPHPLHTRRRTFIKVSPHPGPLCFHSTRRNESGLRPGLHLSAQTCFTAGAP